MKSFNTKGLAKIMFFNVNGGNKNTFPTFWPSLFHTNTHKTRVGACVAQCSKSNLYICKEAVGSLQ